MKRRKRNNPIQQKQNRQQEFNRFWAKMKQTMALLGDASAFKLLSKHDRILMYELRIRPYKIVAGEEALGCFTNKWIKMMNEVLSQSLHNTWIIVKSEPEVAMSLYDFSVYAESLYKIWRNISLTRPAVGDKFRACFPVFEEGYKDIRVDVLLKVEERMTEVAALFSDITSATVRLVKVKVAENKKSVYYNDIKTEAIRAKKEVAEIDGTMHTIFRVMLTTAEKIVPIVITPRQLGINGPMADYPLSVYIQQHVLERIGQRLGTPFVQFHYVLILLALKTAKPLKHEGENKFLFPVNMGRIKLGYLLAERTGDKLVLKTFLFLTNNGTPEGKKLHDLLGLEKADKKYWGIDNLETFVFSDIGESEKLKQLFCEAGCGGLFRINKSLVGNGKQKKIATADLLIHYLRI